MSTFVPTAGRIDRKWHVIDAADYPVGRVASLAAHLLQPPSLAIQPIRPVTSFGAYVVREWRF